MGKLLMALKKEEVPHLTLGPDEKQVESPHICSYACVGCMITKHSHPTTLGELVIFVVEVFWEQKGDKVLR